MTINDQNEYNLFVTILTALASSPRANSAPFVINQATALFNQALPAMATLKIVTMPATPAPTPAPSPAPAPTTTTSTK